MRRWLLAILIAPAAMAWAQAPADATSPATVSISGTVTDAGSGKPLAQLMVAARAANIRGSKPVTSTTDERGRYKLSVPPRGEYIVTVTSPTQVFSEAVKRVTAAGRDIEGVDFRFMVPRQDLRESDR